MKKTLLLGLLFAAGLNANAQQDPDGPLMNGSIAPNFTATDINGVTHTLYDYLDAGKTVIIDFSATWCAPCWNYHNGLALDNLYDSYGPNGSNEVMVFFVEGDHATTGDNLLGISGPAISRGDWTKNTPYPIIDDNATLNLTADDMYHIRYFPTVYRICPGDKTTTVVDQATITSLINGINTNCGAMTGIANHAGVTVATPSQELVCNAGETVGVTAKFKNYGTANITSATVVLKENGTVVATQPYTGNLAKFGTSAAINFADVVVHEGAAYTVEVTQANGTDQTGEIAVEPLNLGIAKNSTNDITINVSTDNYPGEISWEIYAGETLIISDAYEAGTGTDGAGGPDANVVKTYTATIPEGFEDCVTVKLIDSFGDGWGVGLIPTGIEIISEGVTVFKQNVTATKFTTLTTESAFKKGVLANESFQLANFSIYPNPSTGIFNFATEEAADVTVIDMTGKTVYTAKGIQNGGSMNLSALQSGMYIAKIKSGAAEKVEKLIIK